MLSELARLLEDWLLPVDRPPLPELLFSALMQQQGPHKRMFSGLMSLWMMP